AEDSDGRPGADHQRSQQGPTRDGARQPDRPRSDRGRRRQHRQEAHQAGAGAPGRHRRGRGRVPRLERPLDLPELHAADAGRDPTGRRRQERALLQEVRANRPQARGL
ncbi:MAG: LSU ribosomal protein L24p (L26e), partial [uncultured Thermomicrobiales bacterium]